MSARLFQYATSVDPEVIAVIGRNREKQTEWHTRAYEWATRFGATGFYPTGFAGRTAVYAIAIDTHPVDAGRWKKLRRGYAPFKNNPLAKEMAALRFDIEPVPGLPSILHSAYDHEMRHYMMTPHPFLQGDPPAAWVGFTHMPVADGYDREEFGPQWTECLPSQWHAAYEAVTGKTVTTP